MYGAVLLLVLIIHSENSIPLKNCCKFIVNSKFYYQLPEFTSFCGAKKFIFLHFTFQVFATCYYAALKVRNVDFNRI